MKKEYIKNWFSNMLDMDKPLEWEGIKYTTVENFYMAMKTLEWNERNVIAHLSARDSKKYARTIKLREDWETVKFEAMRVALLWKFAPGTSWLEKLMACEDAMIVEVNNWHDNIWGDCVCPKCKDIKGQNHLGKILTEMRNVYRGL